MRPVTERKTRGAVRATRATPARSKRDLPKVQPGVSRGMRKGEGPRRFLKRPIVTLCTALGLLVLIAALLVSGVVGRVVHGIGRGIDTVMTDAGFGISEIHIAGNNRTPYKAVEEALGMQPGESIFSADLWAAQNRLRHLEWIASAEVHRRYPDAIFVTLVEKRPFALWQPPIDAKGETPSLAIVERSGAVITTHDWQKFSRMPKLAGADAAANAAELLDAVQFHRAIAARIKYYSYESSRRWNLHLDNGVTVQLPETGWQKQLDALDHLIIDNGILERDIIEIDLRSPTNFFFVLKSGEKQNVERGKET